MNINGSQAPRSASSTSAVNPCHYANVIKDSSLAARPMALPARYQEPRASNLLSYEVEINEDQLNQGTSTANLLALLQRHPRVPITPSQLSAIALLRGDSVPKYDPICRALYAGKERDLFYWPLPFPYLSVEHDLAEFHKGTVVFWDPLDGTPLQCQGPIQSRPITYSSTLNYGEFLQQYPPRIGSNHAKGNDVWSNFGYVKINNEWIDPESGKEIYDAHMGHSAQFREAEELHAFDRPYLSGPKILTPQEEDEFYQHYTGYVSDEVDDEGDPRHLRISPKMFLRWAAGASRGNTYFEETLPQQHKRQRQKSVSGRISPDRMVREMQFDIGTGSILSPLLDLEDCPSVLESALGVDVTKEPISFSLSCPQSSIDTRLKAHRIRNGSIMTVNSNSVSEATTFETFRSDRARKEYTIPADPENSIAARNRIEELLGLRERGQKATWAHFKGATLAMQAVHDKIRLEKEIFFLRKRVEYLQSQDLLPPIQGAQIEHNVTQYTLLGYPQAKYVVTRHQQTQQLQTHSHSIQNYHPSHKVTLESLQTDHRQMQQYPQNQLCPMQIPSTQHPQTLFHHPIRPQVENSRYQSFQDAYSQAPDQLWQQFQTQATSTEEPRDTSNVRSHSRENFAQKCHIEEHTKIDDFDGQVDQPQDLRRHPIPISTPAISKYPKPSRPHRNQYQKYMDEEMETEQALLWENEQGILYDKKNQAKFDTEIADLRKEKETLLMRLGVQRISDIPHLFPPEREHRPRVHLMPRS